MIFNLTGSVLQQLSAYAFCFFLAGFFILLYLNRKPVSALFSKINPSWLYILPFIISLVVSLFLLPHYPINTPFIGDDFLYLSGADSISISGAYPAQSNHPPGALMLADFLYSIFGRNPLYPMLLTALANSLSALLVALLAYSLTKSGRISFFSSLAYSLAYLPLRISRGFVLDSYLLLFLLFFALSITFYMREKKQEMLNLSVLSLCLALNIKSDALPLLLVFLVVSAIALRSMRSALKSLLPKTRKQLISSIISALILLVLLFPSVAIALSADNSTPGNRYGFSLVSFPGSIISYLRFWAESTQGLSLAGIIIPLFSMLFLAGAWFSLSRKNTEPLKYLLLFWLSNLFLRSAFSIYTTRYMLAGYPAFLIIAAYGFEQLAAFIRNSKIKTAASVLFALFIIADCLPAVSALNISGTAQVLPPLDFGDFSGCRVVFSVGSSESDPGYRYAEGAMGQNEFHQAYPSLDDQERDIIFSGSDDCIYYLPYYYDGGAEKFMESSDYSLLTSIYNISVILVHGSTTYYAPQNLPIRLIPG